jgi:hypothetical protein
MAVENLYQNSMKDRPKTDPPKDHELYTLQPEPEPVGKFNPLHRALRYWNEVIREREWVRMKWKGRSKD